MFPHYPPAEVNILLTVCQTAGRIESSISQTNAAGREGIVILSEWEGGIWRFEKKEHPAISSMLPSNQI